MISDEKKNKEYSRRILTSRMRVLNNHPFFGLMLMHMKFSLCEDVATAATDGEGIMFAPEFLDFLSDGELDFILMHEVLHVALQHCLRGKEYDDMLFNVACDVVVNSTILRANGMNKDSITLRAFGESMHLAPDGKEGYLYTAEQVYEMLVKKSGKRKNEGKGGKNGEGEDGKNQNEGQGGKSRQNKSGSDSSSGKDSGGQDKSGGNNSSEKNSVGQGKSSPLSLSDTKGKLAEKNGTDRVLDDHSSWHKDKNGELADVLTKRLSDAVTAMKMQDPTSERGLVPLCAERFFSELTAAQNDWRLILANFIDEDICDYSFSPPDRRYDSTGFYLPDYNEVEEKVENILFMIDTSGSISDELIRRCYSEIKGALDQFNGHLTGKLGFFDAKVYEPIEFTSEDELLKIRPKGGGGTRFDIIFSYVRNEMSDKPPKSIIILTDGYAPFPEESEADGIPVLWVISTKDITPPFGTVCRISQ